MAATKTRLPVHMRLDILFIPVIISNFSLLDKKKEYQIRISALNGVNERSYLFWNFLVFVKKRFLKSVAPTEVVTSYQEEGRLMIDDVTMTSQVPLMPQTLKK